MKRNDTTDINEYLNLQIHENENFLAFQIEKDEELRQFYANEKIRLANVSLQCLCTRYSLATAIEIRDPGNWVKG